MIIIDGHNLSHAITDIQSNLEEITEIRLCRLVGKYLTEIGEKGEIVFDGTGPPEKQPFDYIANLEVSFAGLGCDADTIIEEKIKANTAPKRLTVVSSDRRIAKAARARRSTSIKSKVFWTEVKKKLMQKEKFKEPPQKHHGLTESETKQWLEFFGIEQ
jgi:predicted RNA-binding protein with PIN domain